MTAGVGFNAQCYADAAAALAGFREGFPKVGTDAVVTLNSSSESGGVVSFNVNRFNLADGSTYTATGSLTLTTCVTGQLTLDDVFSIPTNQAAVDAWAVGFIFPMALGAIAWGIAQVLHLPRS